MMEAIVAAAVNAIALSVVLGAALFALVFGVVRFVPLRAAGRHLLWTLAVLATAVMPLTGLGVSALRTASATERAAAPAAAARRDRSPAASGQRRSAVPASALAAPEAAPLRVRGFAFPQPPALRLTRVAAFAVVGVWLAGALAGLAGLLASVARVRGLKKRSSPLDGDLADELPWLTENHASEREIYLRLSYETETPVAVGFRRPVILIPTQMATASGLAAIEQLVLHEHAHLRRYDDWSNLVQRLIERIFWFNPMVWIVGARIALEREIASDDAVVDETGRAQDYAASLWRLAREMRMPEHAVVAPGALLTRKQISIRIESLLERRACVPAFTPLAAFGVGAAAVACIVAAATSAPALELPAAAPSGAPVQAAATAKPPAPAHRAVTFVVHDAPVERGTAAPRETAHQTPHQETRIIVLHEQRRTAHAPAAPAERPAPGAAAAPPAPPAQPPPLPPDAEAALANLPATISHSVAGALREAADAAARGDVPADAGPATTAHMLARCAGCNFSGRNLRGIDLRNARLTGINLSNADLRDAKLDGARLTGVNLSGARLDGASLAGAAFIGTNVGAISLRGANTAGLTMVGASLANMDLRGLEVRSLLNSCTGCNLAGANLRDADLHGIRLVGANLSGADLSGANVSDAVLNGADLRNANLRGANLRNASFTGASFAGADLRGADTAGARFDGADLRGRQLP